MATKTYKEKLLDPRWQQMRLRIMQREGFACEKCGGIARLISELHDLIFPSSVRE